MSDIAYEERRPGLAEVAENPDDSFRMPGLEREPVAHELKLQLVRYYRREFAVVTSAGGVGSTEVFRVPRGHIAVITRLVANVPAGGIAGLYANQVSDPYLLVPLVPAGGRQAAGGMDAMVQEGEALLFGISNGGANAVIEGNFQIQILRMERLHIGRADKDFADAPEIQQSTRTPKHP